MSRSGLIISAAFCALALLAPWLAPYHPKADTDVPLAAPSARHLLGTDDVGRDILSQVISGSRISILVGLIAGLAAAALGLLVGLLAGYLGGAVDRILMRTVDVFLAMPRLPLLILLAAYLGAGIWVVVICFVLVSWAMPARVVRAQVRVEKQRPYVTSARLSGARSIYVLRKHIVPALSPLALAIVIMEISHAIMIEAGMSFLGLGDPTATSWGTILHHAFSYPALFLSDAWIWWALPPGVCLSLLLLGLALLAMEVERKVDPRIEGGRLGG
ncbi:MAG: ABC transporter permease [Deltaproteobacteria bacterium]|nr:ABC transporter permease [Deltaproteobacteria bacterium]